MDNLSDIDLNIDYSDDDDKNYFDSNKAVINYLFSIEENNLFKIKHLEDANRRSLRGGQPLAPAHCTLFIYVFNLF